MSVLRHVRRVLAGERWRSDGKPIFSGFFSFEGSRRPAWWRDQDANPAWGEVLGVHEAEPGARPGSFLVTELGLALYDDGGVATWVPYSQISKWDPPTKEPPAALLRLWTHEGQAFELPFPRGGAFAFVPFLIGVLGER